MTARKSTLLAVTTFTAIGTTNALAVDAMARFKKATFKCTVANKALAGGGTVNVFVQYSPDGGTSWDDLVSFTQITAAAFANGTREAQISGNGAGFADRLPTDGTLAAGTIRDIDFCDRLRVKVICAAMGVNDTVDISVEALLKP